MCDWEGSHTSEGQWEILHASSQKLLRNPTFWNSSPFQALGHLQEIPLYIWNQRQGLSLEKYQVPSKVTDHSPLTHDEVLLLRFSVTKKVIIVFRQGEVQEPDSVLLSLKSSKFIASTSVGSFLLERNSYSNTSLVRNDIGQLVKLGHCLEKKISLAGLFPFARKKNLEHTYLNAYLAWMTWFNNITMT